MKKILEILLVPFTLVMGFGFALIVMYTLVILLVALLIQLTLRTIEDPTVWLFLADGLCLALIVFIVSRKSIRSSFSEFLKQILRNM